MYRELISELTKNHDWAQLRAPCPESDIDKAEKYVGYTFPDELKALLRETNGDRWLLMSAKDIIENVERNRNILAEYFELDEFLEKVDRHIFFATNGCGDYYCYRIPQNGETDTTAIYLWEHELFENRAVAENMADLIVKYYGGEI